MSPFVYAGRSVFGVDAVHMSWGWKNDGIAAGDYPDLGRAITALGESAERAARVYGRDAAVGQCVAELQVRMRTEGADALSEGRRWSGECGGAFVQMWPVARKGEGPPP